jgi:hypothetical protein
MVTAQSPVTKLTENYVLRRRVGAFPFAKIRGEESEKELKGGKEQRERHGKGNKDKNNPVFWYITPCSPLKINRRFGGTCRLHLQGRRIIQGRNKYEASRAWLACRLYPSSGGGEDRQYLKRRTHRHG